MDHHAVNLKDMKRINRGTVLNTILQRKEVSRTDLVDITGLSPATISALTDELLGKKVIVSVREGESTGGRRPIMLQLNPFGGYILAVNIMSRSIIYSLLNMNLETVHKITNEYSEELIRLRLFEILSKDIDRIFAEGPLYKEMLIGMGVSTQGEVAGVDKKVIFNTGLSLDRIDLDRALSYRYGKPVFMQCPVCAGAVAEYYSGAARDLSDYVCLNIGEDIRTVVVHEGKLLRNTALAKNNLAHMIIDRSGPECSCGQRGCLGTYTTTEAIVRRSKMGIIEGRDTVLRKICNGDINNVDFDVVSRCLFHGDAFLQNVIRDAAEALCIGILNFRSVFRVSNIIISGKLREIGFLSQALQEVAAHFNSLRDEKIRISLDQLRYDGVNIGNGAIVLRNYLESL